MDVKTVAVMVFVNMDVKSPRAKSAVDRLFANMAVKENFVKSVTAHRYVNINV